MVAPHHRGSPARALEAAFRRIEAEAMADLEVHNRQLRVEVLAPRLWKGRWLTVLITPWCMNLVLLPAPGGEWTSGIGQERLFYKFPAGDFAFLCGVEAEVGEYHSCALFSSTADFPDQDCAREAAALALDTLLQAAAAAVMDKAQESADKPTLSRRAFLSGGKTRS